MTEWNVTVIPNAARKTAVTASLAIQAPKEGSTTAMR